jgi:transcriptional regulator with XRE-family HTH domain
MDAKAFGALVRRRRKALGMTQKELALSIDSGLRFIIDLEGGKKTSQLGKALAAARAVGVELVDAAQLSAGSPPSDEGYDLSFTKGVP